MSNIDKAPGYRSYDDVLTNIIRPHVNHDGKLYHRAFYEFPDILIPYDNSTNFNFSILTNEKSIDTLNPRPTEDQAPYITPYKRMLSQIDRIKDNHHEAFKYLIDLNKQAILSGKTGRVIYSHGIGYHDPDKPDRKWGIKVSKDIVDKEGLYFYSNKQRNDPRNKGGHVDALTIISELQENPKTAYLLILSCNDDVQKIPQDSVKIPIIYYVSSNGIQDPTTIEILTPKTI